MKSAGSLEGKEGEGDERGVGRRGRNVKQKKKGGK